AGAGLVSTTRGQVPSTDAVVRRHIRALLDAAARSADTKDKAMAKAKTARATDADTIAVGGGPRPGPGRRGAAVDHQ
ncbi:hypothetical protein J7F02_34410, partial [Streptomyces sp. ISL-112]